jgi:hypothetical protein
MPLNDMITVGAICSVFLTFMAVLGGVAWWSNRPVRKVEAKAIKETVAAAWPDRAAPQF